MIAPPTLELLHHPVTALVRAYGVPLSVATRDDGQRFVFGDASSSVTAVVDDDTTVHALDVVLPAKTSYAVDLDGETHRVIFGATTSLGARDAFAAEAETEGTGFRVFRRSPDSDVVLVFDPGTSLLTHVVVGDRATLLRLGYITDPTPTQPRFPFTVPALVHSAVTDGAGSAATVVRLDLDRGGVVTKVAIVVPSADLTYDRRLTAQIAHDVYRPAKLGGRPIGASVFREVRH
ncbi:MAG: hypothetical protein ABI186_03275 [Candidatus Elarobacter sp.]